MAVETPPGKNHVLKGAHPVRYCPQCENPVGDHDLLEGDKAEILKFTLVMFRYGRLAHTNRNTSA